MKWADRPEEELGRRGEQEVLEEQREEKKQEEQLRDECQELRAEEQAMRSGTS